MTEKVIDLKDEVKKLVDEAYNRGYQAALSDHGFWTPKPINGLEEECRLNLQGRGIIK